MTKKSILVTGASGFLGRSLVGGLLDAGYSVRAATRTSQSFPKSVDVVIVPDFHNRVDWTPILSDIDIVIHLAGPAHIDMRKVSSGGFNLVSRVATQDIVDAAKKEGIERIVFISSVRAQAGASNELTVRETDDARPTNEYGRTKLDAETIVRESGVPFTILRPVAVYGPKPRGNVKALMHLAMSPWPLPILGLTNRRSFLSIENFISAVLFVLNTPATVRETYLVADPAPYRVCEIVTMIRKAMGRRPGLIYVPPAFLHLALILISRGYLWHRIGEDLVVDTHKLQAVGWRPVADSYESIVAMIRAETGATRS